ncbi:hypothetical protein BDZ89DRAFT_1071488 [Hymenopellis radicata]|nr:hypothetical protein BDZ89DRAFT_1071488 [Hymenopellis radicata]
MSARLVETLPLSRDRDTRNVKIWIAAPTQTQVTPSIPDPRSPTCPLAVLSESRTRALGALICRIWLRGLCP